MRKSHPKNQQARKATTPTVADLAPRNTAETKGGAVLSSAVADVIKNFGAALQTASRG